MPVGLDDLQQLADPRIVGDAGAHEPHPRLAVPRQLLDRLASASPRAVPDGPVHLPLQAEAAAAAAALADLEQGHVAVLGVGGLHRGDGLEIESTLRSRRLVTIAGAPVATTSSSAPSEA